MKGAANKENLRTENLPKRVLTDVDDKLNSKIFKLIDESIKMIESGQNYNNWIDKLIIADKLCVTTYDENDVVSIFIKFLLIQSYNKLKDFDRWLRNIERLSKRVFALYKKRKLKRETANLLLHIHKIWGDIQMMKGRHKKAVEIYTELTELYTIWKSCSYRSTVEYWIDYQEYEFTDDHILEAKSSLGEALMSCGETVQAVDRFEEAKRQFQKCLVFSNELIYINIWNQLANCYIKLDKKDKALENFEISRKMLEDSKEDLPVDSLILAKIKSNIASIYFDTKDKLLEAIKLYQDSLILKRQKLPEYHEEIEIAYTNLADCYYKVGEFTEAYDCYDHAYEVSKNVYGKNHKTTAKHILSWAKMKNLTKEYDDAIKLYEYGARLFQSIEKGVGSQGRNILIKIIEINYNQRNDIKAYNSVSELLGVIDSCKPTEEKYTIYNELANILRKNNQYKLAIEIYK